MFQRNAHQKGLNVVNESSPANVKVILKKNGLEYDEFWVPLPDDFSDKFSIDIFQMKDVLEIDFVNRANPYGEDTHAVGREFYHCISANDVEDLTIKIASFVVEQSEGNFKVIAFEMKRARRPFATFLTLKVEEKVKQICKTFKGDDKFDSCASLQYFLIKNPMKNVLVSEMEMTNGSSLLTAIMERA